jgi:hypothetical protein
MANPNALIGDANLEGWLYILVAFDWGDEVNLEQAGRLAPGAILDLPPRPRTPTSIAYKRRPLHFSLGAQCCELPHVEPLPTQSAEATVFDFGGVSVAFKTRLQMPRESLSSLAGRLADMEVRRALIRAARQAVAPLHDRLRPAIGKAEWNPDLWEEYFVFHLPPGAPLLPEPLLSEDARWLAGLLRLEDQVLSDQETAEAVRLTLRYGAKDLFVPDWAACVLLDDELECSETLRVIELANLQLLEYRHIDDRLDANLAQASLLIGRAARSRLPFWKVQEAPLRVLGELKVEATGLFERTGNVLKLVGDPYLARVYRLLATRFHLREWERAIQHKLEVIEGVYQVVSDQTVAFRAEFMEVIVIVLIIVEIVLGLYHH